ncbi:MAG: hypothetical protein K8S87_07235 [Planctomycetes bacterium]|nr:hypothetical protein [Planctomycetota bacterium]
MRSKNSLLSFIFILVISVVTLFAQTGDIVENQTKPKEKPQTTTNKVRENVTLRYEVSPVPMKYLFTSKTEANVKIENLTDASKNKEFVSTLNSTTSLILTSDEVSVDDFKIKVAIDKISGAYNVDDKEVEFSITKDGMKTKIDGETDAELRELSAWRDKSPQSLGKTIAEFTLTPDGKIKNAVSYTSGGENATQDTTGSMGETSFDKSLIYLQNPLTLMNLIFWKLPAKKLEFDRIGKNPSKPTPAWDSSINYPFDNPFEFESVDSKCSIVSVIEKQIELPKSDAKDIEEKNADKVETEEKPEIQKIITLHRVITHPTDKNLKIVAFLDYDLNKRLPVLVTYDIYHDKVLTPTKDRKITISQKTTYRFILQK